MGIAAQNNNNLLNGTSNPTSTNGTTDRNVSSSGTGVGSADTNLRSSPSSISTPGPINNSFQPPLSSLENLLGNIQNLLKVAAESVRHEEKQWNREKGQI